ncbi:protein-disulfide reductase DsbD family protein [Chitinophaga arvensicola]|uniref:Disulphide bond corrector protein DsbC n=1 Tax=Chitinophaga arvensicola TaxID=29529 RepID=A0A1I0RP74_9BACT|nr:protein-disulfide reductase DsbD family protein [Chitinophaga arvensicola]SEW43095.1 Disulphide bond corrector protein DsbC [Chitinophaga arvensicola]
MKSYRILFMLLILLLPEKLTGQIKWTFSSEKKTDSLFEIHLTADIEKGWHLYSQWQPPEAIAEPAAIIFEKSPSVQLHGHTREMGIRETYENRELGIKSFQYSSRVDFVQLISVGRHQKTTVNGVISFMLCDDKECLPTIMQKFSLQLL